MKKSVLLLFLLSGLLSVCAQESINIQTTFSEVFKDDKKFTELDFSLDDTKGGVYIGRGYKKGCYIEHYDSSLKLIDSYDFELDNKNSHVLEAFINNDKLTLVEANYNKGDKQLQYQAHTSPLDKFNFSTKTILGIDFEEFRKIAAIVAFVPINFGGFDSDFFGDMVISKDRKHFVITQDIKGKDEELRQIHVFNDKMEKLYSHNFKRDIKDRKFDLQNVDIDTDGTVYLLGKVKTEKAKRKDDGGKYEYELYKIHGESREMISFDSAEKYIGSLTTVVNDGEVFCVGFYSERNDYRYKGLAHLKLNSDELSISSATYSPFTDQFVIDKYGKEKDKELRNIDFKAIHVTKNNEIILTGEEFFITTTFVQGITYTTFHYRDIISAKMDASGKLLWARNINKAQSSSTDSPYLSFTSDYNNGKVYFFINGDDDVRKIRNDRIEFRPTSIKKMNLYAISLDESGEMNYDIIIGDDESEVAFSAGNGVLLNNGEEVIFQGRRRKKKQIAKLQL